ncbi:MAG: hypothetical protein R3330_19425, partial [Saprospiraceae bacterium]|nr:hypothetical protein [Saprospiraceae bacterium]
MSTIEWIRNDDEGLTWSGAVASYGYTDLEKEAAYLRLGHVGHLIGDMAQPDHVHLERHTHWPLQPGEVPFDDDYIEGWTVDNWAYVEPSISSLEPIRYSVLEDWVHNLALTTWYFSSFTGYLDEGKRFLGLCVGEGASGRVTEAFDVRFEQVLRNWAVSNKFGMAGSNLGNWQGGTCENQPCATGVQKDNTDNFWECSAETSWGAGTRYGRYYPGRGAGCSYFYVERLNTAYPKIYWGINGARHDQSSLSKSDQKSLAYIYTKSLLPLAVEHIAGAYMHYMDIVRHPPVLMSMVATQDDTCIHGQHWRPSNDG